jgi:hypothetical protein
MHVQCRTRWQQLRARSGARWRIVWKEVDAVEIHYDPNQSLEDLLNDFASEGKFRSIT